MIACKVDYDLLCYHDSARRSNVIGCKVDYDLLCYHDSARCGSDLGTI